MLTANVSGVGEGREFWFLSPQSVFFYSIKILSSALIHQPCFCQSHVVRLASSSKRIDLKVKELASYCIETDSPIIVPAIICYSRSH
ncbi:hypothetical protein SAMN05444008_114135 [Cnuella takakiae]|uniref:Uncharacterized protein n=1 Tax=Cnuella takakiae TaxID=1302690 RepID=A0A1M5FSE2_9BACT|nr:hypothetical protein SAMN05444008_114135 [Cnuella takakiae]